ncbi:glycosyltransferase [Chloroflexota bacterium]
MKVSEGPETPRSLKKVLIIAYVFPPSAGSAVWRTLKFVKHLPEFGWQPYVVTPRSPDHSVFDPSLLKDVPPEARVYRVAALPLGRWVSALSSLLLKRPISHEYVGFPKEAFNTSRPLVFRVLRALIYGFLVPDSSVGWVPFAVSRGVNLVRRHRIDAIYATGTPWSDFMAGYLISLLTGRDLILDFRDLWTLHPWVPSEGWLNDTLDRLWERRIVTRARHMVFTTENWIQRYRERYPKLPPEKFHYIPHGYDPQDFGGLAPQKDPYHFTVSHVGTVTYPSRADVFLTAVRCLVDRRPELWQRLRIRFIGTGGALVQEWVNKLYLQSIVEVIPYVDHTSSLQYLLDSHLLLLLNHNPPDLLLAAIGGKTYEYLASGVPVLALTPEGAVADLIRHTNAGTVVELEDVDGIEQSLEYYCAAFSAGAMPRGAAPESVIPFQRREATRQLAALIDGVAVSE